MRNRKISIFIELKLNENFAKMDYFPENEVKTFCRNTSKFANILNENERISFVYFREFRSTKNFDENPTVKMTYKNYVETMQEE